MIGAERYPKAKSSGLAGIKTQSTAIARIDGVGADPKDAIHLPGL